MVHLMGIVAIFQKDLCDSFHIICAEFLHILWGGHGLYCGEYSCDWRMAVYGKYWIALRNVQGRWNTKIMCGSFFSLVYFW